MTFSGVDAVQAMVLTLGIVPDVISYLTRSAGGGRVTWEGGEDLGFPPRVPAHEWQFTPADGSAPRQISVRIGPAQGVGERWSVLVEVMEFGEQHRVHERRLFGASWANTLELAAAAVPGLLQERVDQAGGGILEAVDDSPACCVQPK